MPRMEKEKTAQRWSNNKGRISSSYRNRLKKKYNYNTKLVENVFQTQCNVASQAAASLK